MKHCKLCNEEISLFEAAKNGEICDVCADNADDYNELKLIGDSRDQLRSYDDPPEPEEEEHDLEIDVPDDDDF